MSNQALQERFSQMESSIKDVYRLAYAPDKYGWNELDAKIRTLEENICVVLVYAVFGSSNPEEKLKDGQKPLYGRRLVQTVITHFNNNGIDKTIPDKLYNDICTHNENCHGSDISMEIRKANGRTNVFASLPLLVNIFESDLHSFPYISSYKEDCTRLGAFLKYSLNLLQRPAIDIKAKSILEEHISSQLLESSVSAGQYHFCLLLPENPSKDLIDKLRPLANIRWSIVIDLGYEVGEAYKMWIDVNPQIVNNTALTGRLDPNQTNWYFLNGRRHGMAKSDVRLNYSKLKGHPLPMKECVLIDLTQDIYMGFEAIKTLWEMLIAPDDRESSVLSHIISVKSKLVDNVLFQKLKDNDYEVASFSSIPLSPEEFVETAMRIGIFPTPNVYGDIFAYTDHEAFHTAGIRFLDSEDKSEQFSLWDNFYAGRPISTEELRRNFDVQPRCPAKRDKSFERLINEAYSNPDSSEFKIVHEPGAGGSTIARRIAYNLFCESKWLPVFIKEFKSVATVEMLKKMSDSLGGVKRLLIITDDKDINATQQSDLYKRLRQASIFPIFLRIRHEFTLNEHINDRNTLQVAANLSSLQIVSDFDNKFGSFFSQYLSHDKTEKILNQIHELDTLGSEKPEMINYPYAFCEELAEKGNAYILMKKKDYVSKWFGNIVSDQLKDLCGYTALIYRFTASRHTDSYGLISLWNTPDYTTLQTYPTEDLQAIHHILKISIEENLPGDRSTFLAPRYASFAEAILDVWKIGWRNRLSDIVVDFIKNYNSKLNDREEDLFSDLFTQQSRINKGVATTGDSSIPFNDRFSLLIGFILDSEEGIDGVRKIFKVLIDKYPDNVFYKLHFGRILFEYAHKEGVDYSDKLFSDAETLVTEALSMSDKSDDSIHVVGMYWSRYAAAVARSINACGKNEMMDLETTLKEAIDKAYECFEECNELNSGTSPYGYFSTANLMIKSLDWYKRINEILHPEVSYIDTEPCLTFIDILGYCTSELTRFSYDDDEREGLDFNRIQHKYLELLGDKEKALDRAQEKYLSASDTTQVIYGHQFMSLCITKRNSSEPLRAIYNNIDPERVKFLITMLSYMANMGDLRAAEQLFNLNRYHNHDLLNESVTTTSLEHWHALAIEKHNNRHILKSTFYLYVCYAAQLIISEVPDASIKKKYLAFREECRKLTDKLEEDPHKTWAILGNDETNKWSCILDYAECIKYDKASRSRIYTSTCRRVHALFTGNNGRQGDCECGELTMISFRRGNIPEYEIGKLYLRDGIIGFRYYGAGLFNFSDKYNSDDRVEVEKTRITTHDSTKPTTKLAKASTVYRYPGKSQSESKGKNDSKSSEVLYRTETEQQGIRHPIIVGKIDLDTSNITSRHKKNKK